MVERGSFVRNNLTSFSTKEPNHRVGFFLVKIWISSITGITPDLFEMIVSITEDFKKSSVLEVNLNN